MIRLYNSLTPNMNSDWDYAPDPLLVLTNFLLFVQDWRFQPFVPRASFCRPFATCPPFSWWQYWFRQARGVDQLSPNISFDWDSNLCPRFHPFSHPFYKLSTFFVVAAWFRKTEVKIISHVGQLSPNVNLDFNWISNLFYLLQLVHLFSGGSGSDRLVSSPMPGAVKALYSAH